MNTSHSALHDLDLLGSTSPRSFVSKYSLRIQLNFLPNSLVLGGFGDSQLDTLTTAYPDFGLVSFRAFGP